VLIAEIRHKLLDLGKVDANAPDALGRIRQLLLETKEDLLTADVFGALKYLPRRPYLESVLCAAARRARHSRLARELPSILDGLSGLKFEFWPSYPTPSGLEGSVTEPDVELSGPDLLMFFEAKLLSGFGTLQVARELAVGLDQAGDRSFYLTLVTPHHSPRGFKVAGRRVGFHSYVAFHAQQGDIAPELSQHLLAAADRILWMSWADILAALKQGLTIHAQGDGADSEAPARAADVIGDLVELVQMRGIRPFRGLGRLPSPSLAAMKRPIMIQASLVGRYTFIGLKLQTMPRLRDAGSVGEIRWTWRDATVADGPRLAQVAAKWQGRLVVPWGFRAKTSASLLACIRRHRVDRLRRGMRLFSRTGRLIPGVVAAHRVPDRLRWTFRGNRNAKHRDN
jgi:hypothetical protein